VSALVLNALVVAMLNAMPQQAAAPQTVPPAQAPPTASQAAKPEPKPDITVKEEVIVTATRSNTRVQDEPLRVEVLGREEIEEKLLMTPGDIAMLLSETTGLRVQVTSPGLGAASLRIQGLRGRYTQLLSDGLPLYGGQSGSIGVLQIPPMDLGQVELIKGVASSLFGSSALGGVVNLVSRRPGDTREHDVLFNQTTLGGTDGIMFLSGPLSERWGYTLLANADRQTQRDTDSDGWADVASFRRITVRPRLFWDNKAGRSLLVTTGAMFEERIGGTRPGRNAPNGAPFVEAIDSSRGDVGVVGRMLIGSAVLGARGSFMAQQHGHQFGDVTEDDTHKTGFGELSLTSVRGKHTWVLGAAMQGDGYRALQQRRFNFTHWMPSVFAQDDIRVSSRVSFTASARLDRHSEYGTILSPRIGVLLHLGEGWTMRMSAGMGYFAPTPLTEETEAVGLTRLAAIAGDEPERAQSYSADISRLAGRVEMNVSVFGSRVTDTRVVSDLGFLTKNYALVPLAAPTNTVGGEALIRTRLSDVTVVASYTLVHATEPDPVTNIRRDVAMTPRHSTGLTAMWEREDVGRVGIEWYVTGPQRLEDNPYRAMSPVVHYVGAMAERVFGKARLFINTENLGNRRQTRHDSLLRATRRYDGRWTVEAWAPLDGFVANAGVRIRF
jgi:outer membrane receptor for ferrienterochelin and colicins